MLHEIVEDLHEFLSMHAACMLLRMLMYMYVSCNMHGFWTIFIMHHACYVNVTCVLHVTKKQTHAL